MHMSLVVMGQSSYLYQINDGQPAIDSEDKGAIIDCHYPRLPNHLSITKFWGSTQTRKFLTQILEKQGFGRRNKRRYGQDLEFMFRKNIQISMGMKCIIICSTHKFHMVTCKWSENFRLSQMFEIHVQKNYSDQHWYEIYYHLSTLPKISYGDW